MKASTSGCFAVRTPSARTPGTTSCAGGAACVVVGDSVWDMKAAARGGFVGVGLTCGGTSPEELRDAGATAVYDGPAELDPAELAQLPGRGHGNV